MAAKDEVFDFMYEWFGKHKEPPTVRQVWKAATKAAEARFTSHNKQSTPFTCEGCIVESCDMRDKTIRCNGKVV